jgi:hypothetical protein
MCEPAVQLDRDAVLGVQLVAVLVPPISPRTIVYVIMVSAFGGTRS